jgi:hypothetical protein
VAGEAVRIDEVVDLRVAADDGVLVEHVVIVVAGPGADDPERLESRNAGGKRRPEFIFEDPMIGLEVRRVAWAVMPGGGRRRRARQR